ncbi:MAG: hypothetical protein MUE51_12040 [Thermoleophilia bacterium]|nr:hypothetical protein [Thermoleophilia bacterium]
MAAPTPPSFTPGQDVVHPRLGPGRVLGVSGDGLEVEFANGLTSTLTIDRARAAGLRPVLTSGALKQVLKDLAKPLEGRPGDADPAQRRREAEVAAGGRMEDLVSVARALAHRLAFTTAPATTDRRAQEAVIVRIASEFAVAGDMGEDEALGRVREALAHATAGLTT